MSLVPLSNSLVQMSMQEFAIRQVELEIEVEPYRVDSDGDLRCYTKLNSKIRSSYTKDPFAIDALYGVHRIMSLSQHVTDALHVASNEGTFLKVAIKASIVGDKSLNGTISKTTKKLEIKAEGTANILLQLIARSCERGHQSRLLEALDLD